MFRRLALASFLAFTLTAAIGPSIAEAQGLGNPGPKWTGFWCSLENGEEIFITFEEAGGTAGDAVRLCKELGGKIVGPGA